ncbi:hypothetical protein OF83DRAFT_1083960 [Amylostereum chailletii]|nr:hypothetical protein OF83DRAFT_1083960 [Amylostereum chailletii]
MQRRTPATAKKAGETRPYLLPPCIGTLVDHFEKTSFKGKVLLVTGASRGIGQQTAVDYVRAGVTVVIVSRQQTTLDETKVSILKAVPVAQVLAIPVDVKNPEQAAKAIETTVRFRRSLTVRDKWMCCVACELTVRAELEDKDPLQWWNVSESRSPKSTCLASSTLCGSQAVINRPSLVHLKKANGYIVAISSVGAQYRNPLGSDYSIFKHALGRLVEFIRMGKFCTIIYSQPSSKYDAMITEYPEIKTFALQPGGVRTQLAVDAKLDPTVELDDPPELAAATMLYLTSGNADWFSGRYVSSNWDLGEVERDWRSRTKIVEQGGLMMLSVMGGDSTSKDAGAGIKDKNPGGLVFIVRYVVSSHPLLRPAITYLEKASGYIVAVGSGAAQIRVPYASDYGVSKHALNRPGSVHTDAFDWIENPTIKAFTLHPGSIATRIAEEAGVLGIQPTPDGVELPAAVTLNLTSGKVDWLNGWYVSANWDFDEVEKVWKQKIIEGDALVNKLYIP